MSLSTTHQLNVPKLDLKKRHTTILGEKTYEVKAIFHGRAPMCLVGDKLCFSSRSGKDIVIHENTAPYKNVCEVKNAHEMIINALTGTSNGGALLYSGGWDKFIKRWQIENGSCVPVDSCDVGEVVNVMTMGDNNIIYAGCGNGSIVKVDN